MLRLLLALVLLAGCAEPPNATTTRPFDAVNGECLLVATAEFGVDGAVAVLRPADGTLEPRVTSTFHDATLHRWDEGVLVLNRRGRDSVQALVAADGWRTRWETPLPEATNPVDVVIDGDGRGVVVGRERGELIPFRETAGGLRLDAPVPLDDWADPDGNADPSHALLRGDTLYVVLQRLDAFRCADTPPAVLALRWPQLTAREDWAGGGLLELSACNPTSVVATEDGVWIGQSGEFRSLAETFGRPVDNDGGLEWVDLGQGISSGLLLGEADVNGDISALAASSSGLLALISDESFDAQLVRIDISEASAPLPWMPLYQGLSLFDVQEVEGTIWVATRDPDAPGVVALNSAGDVLQSAVSTGLPPASLHAPATCDAR